MFLHIYTSYEFFDESKLVIRNYIPTNFVPIIYFIYQIVFYDFDNVFRSIYNTINDCYMSWIQIGHN